MAAVIDTLLFPVEAAGPLPPYADRPVPGSGLALACPGRPGSLAAQERGGTRPGGGGGVGGGAGAVSM